MKKLQIDQYVVPEIETTIQPEPKTWVYVFVRRDIPLQQQLVQASHAALEAGIKFGNKHQIDPSSIVLIGVKSEEQLKNANEYVKSKNIDTVMFYEPDFDMGYSAFATVPVTTEMKHNFRKFQLWK